MKLTWKNKRGGDKSSRSVISRYPNLPFDRSEEHDDEHGKPDSDQKIRLDLQKTLDSEPLNPQLELAEAFQSEGNKLAEEGKYQDALGKWEAALTLVPERTLLHEQKAQVLLEIGDAWNALKAATQATELEPSWAEAWITLARAQLNFGEPDEALKSFDKALQIKPDCEEALDDRQTALQLVKRRKILHSSGLSATENRYMVGDKDESYQSSKGNI